MNQESVVETNAMGNAWIIQQILRHLSDSMDDFILDMRSVNRNLDIIFEFASIFR